MDSRVVWGFEHKAKEYSALTTQAEGDCEGDQGIYPKRADKDRKLGLNQEF